MAFAKSPLIRERLFLIGADVRSNEVMHRTMPTIGVVELSELIHQSP